MNIIKLNKKFIFQHGQSDCGPACLASVIRFHGGSLSLDEIRRITGTTKTGTKLLGLFQGAKQLGFDAFGLEAEGIDSLKELNHPAVLHVILENRLQHYLVFYGFENDLLIIGDPEKGVSLWSKEQLSKIWKSKSLLTLTPNQNFNKLPKKTVKYAQIIDWIKEDFNILLASLFLGILIASFSLATSIFSQKLIDVILPTKEITKLIIGLILIGIVLLVRIGLGFVRSTFLITQSRDFNNRMINSYLNLLLHLPKPFFNSKKIGEMIARMNDTSRIQVVVSNLAGNMLIESLVLIASLVGIFIYSWQVGIIVLLYIPIYIVILYRLNQPIITAQKDVMSKNALNESNYIDVISGVSEIKATGTTDLFKKTTNLFYQVYQSSIFNLGKIQIKFGLQTDLAGILLNLSVISFSSYLVITDQLLLGVMMAILSLGGTIGPSLTSLALFNTQLQEAKVAFNRIEEFTTLETEKMEGESISQIESLEITNLSFNFPGSLPLLKRINLKIDQGRIITLLGESGTGKSTILQLLQCFYEPVSGNILANNLNIRTLELRSYRKEIGVVPQDIKVFNNYLLFNIALSEDPKKLKQVPQWCRENGFDQFFSKFPQGYMTLLGEEGVNISGGQKQLVGLARALYRNPSVVLIDEGTSAMDRKTEQFILNMIRRIKKDKAILMVTHRMKVAQESDYVYFLENGEIIREGKPTELQSIFETPYLNE
ncbi:MAG: peptidase domain-containing ABC transporter [Bacteroidota bacterium]